MLMASFVVVVFNFIFYLSIVDLQCCVSFRIQQSDSSIHTYIYIYILDSFLLQVITKY